MKRKKRQNKYGAKDRTENEPIPGGPSGFSRLIDPRERVILQEAHYAIHVTKTKQTQRKRLMIAESLKSTHRHWRITAKELCALLGDRTYCF